MCSSLCRRANYIINNDVHSLLVQDCWCRYDGFNMGSESVGSGSGSGDGVDVNDLNECLVVSV